MTVLRSKNRSLDLQQWRTGLKRLCDDIWMELLALGGGVEVPVNIPANVSEDLSQEKRGASWMSPAYTVPAQEPLFQLIYKTRKLADVDHSRAGNSLVWNRIQCNEFLAKTGKIIEKIAVACHTIPAPPVRGTTMMDTLIRNTSQRRNYYKEHGKSVFIFFNTKTSSITGHDGFTVAYLPDQLAKVLDYYLLVVRPLEYLIATGIFHLQQQDLYTNYLYVKDGVRISASQFGNVFK